MPDKRMVTSDTSRSHQSGKHNSELSRRQFLKLLAAAPLISALPRFPKGVDHKSTSSDASKPNILILLFDAFSAPHASLYGYRRQTTPNLESFAERATVYHAHYSAGNFTSPGTTSLLSGTYPWVNRAFSHYNTVPNPIKDQNFLSVFADAGYSTVTYTHNLLVAAILSQLRAVSGMIKPRKSLCLIEKGIANEVFPNDYFLAQQRERLFRGGDSLTTLPTSLLWFVSDLLNWELTQDRVDHNYETSYPEGLPRMGDCLFRLEDTFDWLSRHLKTVPQPFMVYLHLGPPHDPYLPSRQYVGKFHDGWLPKPKPESVFSEDRSLSYLQAMRDSYDEFIAYADGQFGRLIEQLEHSGILDNTWVIVTSDHGELFERGIWMHWTPVLYEPLIRIPLIISRPGQGNRGDVTVPTSAVDLLPTLFEATGMPLPAWGPGYSLNNISGVPEERPVYALDSKSGPRNGPLSQGSLAMRKGSYKLIHYFGYDVEQSYELFDLKADPEERRDLYAAGSPVSKTMREELMDKLQQINNLE